MSRALKFLRNHVECGRVSRCNINHLSASGGGVRPYVTTPGQRANLSSSSKVRHAGIPLKEKRCSSSLQQGDFWKTSNAIPVDIDGRQSFYSPLHLRDMCACEKCVDPSTKQKSFSTAEIPPNIVASSIEIEGDSLVVKWENDLPGMNRHVTRMSLDQLRRLKNQGNLRQDRPPPRRTLWDAAQYEKDVKDVSYEAYIKDDQVLHQVLQQLHTHGLVFLTGVPDVETSVSTIAERIGPVKNTFYGYTWDVRSVPEAVNVAYTSQDLGFHMDLMYMQQPPRLQFLHCIRSSSVGGASLFTDSLRAAIQLQAVDRDAFSRLANLPVHFHYDHPDAQYSQERRVIELKDISSDQPVRQYGALNAESAMPLETEVQDAIEALSWSPPFQAPFTLHHVGSADAARLQHMADAGDSSPQGLVADNLKSWHEAAKKFSDEIHQPSGIYERLMGPGECVLFDNRRVLHARTAFDVDDLGKERWLRGCYVDSDPYQSKMKVLQRRFS